MTMTTIITIVTALYLLIAIGLVTSGISNNNSFTETKEDDIKMDRIAKFSKVSFEQFKKDWIDVFRDRSIYTDDVIKEIYDSIKLPKRATQGSGGYDIYIPDNIHIPLNTSRKIPTGIRCKMYNGYVLQIHPRSGQGFKYGIHLANTTGIIDSDYYNSDNEGHIFVKLINDSLIAKPIDINRGEAFCQGVFVPFGITIDDDATAVRNGGLGSTSRKEI